MSSRTECECRRGVPTHVENHYGKDRYWCEMCTPWSGHYEFCHPPDRTNPRCAELQKNVRVADTTRLPLMVLGTPVPRIEIVGHAVEEVFSAEALDMLGWAEHYVAKVPSHQPDGDWVRCHEIARAVGRLLDVKVIDGTYGISLQHSWLELPCSSPPHERQHILDVYAPGRLPRVQLVDTFYLLPEGKNLYNCGPSRSDVREDIVAWLLMRMGQ